MAEMPQLARAGAAAPRRRTSTTSSSTATAPRTRWCATSASATRIGDFLEARGFYVARDSFSNYISTGPSLASTFHMDYLDALAADPRVSGNNWHPIFRMLDDNRVGRFLRGRGYEQHQFGSWWVGTYHNPNAFSNRPLGFSEFNMTYLGGPC